MFAFYMFAIVSSVAAYVAVDHTTDHRKCEANVALAAVRKVHDSCIFPRDNGILYRTAYAETEFEPPGCNDGEINNGGMWNVRIKKLNLLKDRHPKYDSISSEIQANFGIDFEKYLTNYTKYNTPLSDAIFTRFLYDQQNNRAIDTDLDEQENIYKHLFSAENDEVKIERFRDDDKVPECSLMGADILLALEIKSERYNHMWATDFVNRFIGHLQGDEFQFAVYGFSNKPESSAIDFRKSFGNLDVEELNYRAHNSEGTVDGLREVIESAFGTHDMSKRRKRGYPRIAVVIAEIDLFEDAQRDTEFGELIREMGVSLYGIGKGKMRNSELFEPSCVNFRTIPHSDKRSIIWNYLDHFTKSNDHLLEAMKQDICRMNAKFPNEKDEKNGNDKAINIRTDSIPREKSLSVQIPLKKDHCLLLEGRAIQGHFEIHLSSDFRNPGPDVYEDQMKVEEKTEVVSFGCHVFKECKNSYKDAYSPVYIAATQLSSSGALNLTMQSHPCQAAIKIRAEFCAIFIIFASFLQSYAYF